jgi:VWFA-related protein
VLTSLSVFAHQQKGVAPQTTLKVTTRVVAVEVVAVDKNGHPVSDLKPDEFEIFEKSGTDAADNIATFWTAHKVQEKIASFEYISYANSPSPRAAPPKLPAGVFSNLTEISNSSPPSILLLDALNTVTKDQVENRRQMLMALKNLPPHTPVAVFLLGYNLRLLQDFSKDNDLINQAVDKAISNQILVQPNPQDDDSTANGRPQAGLGSRGAAGLQTQLLRNFEYEQYDQGIEMRVQTTMAALRSIAQHVSGYEGRKNLVWLSGSFPLFIAPIPRDGGPNELRYYREYGGEVKKTADLLTNAHIAVYPVSAQGLDMSVPIGGGSAGTNRGADLAQQEARASQDRFARHATLLEVAERTGGQACVNTNDLAGCVKDAFENGSSYYQLTYYPVDYKANGEYRRILVHTTRPGVRLSYRNGYFATEAASTTEAKPGPTPMNASTAKKDAKPEGPLAEAIFNTPLVSTVIPLQVRTVAQLPEYAKYEISIQADALTLLPSETDTKTQLSVVEIGAAGFDLRGGTTQFFQSRLTQKIPESDYQRIQEQGFTHTITVPLKPGTAHVRLAIRDVNSGRLGTIDLTIPNSPARSSPQQPHS